MKSKSIQTRPRKEKKIVTIADLPLDIASALYDHFCLWEQEPQLIAGIMEPMRLDGRGRIRTYTLRSLILLSHRSYSTWLPFLLANVRLEWKQLAYVFDLMIRVPNALENFRHLTFVDENQKTKEVEEVRGIFLEQAPNLQSLTAYDDSGFPFAIYQKSVKDFVSPKGLLSLKKISIRWDIVRGGYSYLSSSNVLFILSLPNLEVADLDAAFYPKDIDFILEHSEGWKGSNRRSSNVKDLLLKLRFMAVEGASASAGWDPQRTSEGIQDLLLYTSGLKRFGVFPLCQDGVGDQLDTYCLQGLKNSFSSLETLELKNLSLALDEELGSFEVLSKFQNLKVFVMNNIFSIFYMLLNEVYPQMFEKDIFGSSPLEEIKLLGNYINFGDDEVDDFLSSEKIVVELITKYPKIQTLKKIVTQRFPTNWGMVTRKNVATHPPWKEARKELRKVCKEEGIELELVD